MPDHARRSSDLPDSVALVSGAAGGIGLEVCHSLRKAGVTVVGLDLRGPEAQPESESIDWVSGDVGDEADVSAAVKSVRDRHGRLDLLVHCAGIARDAVLWKLPASDWDEVQRVNLRGAFLLMQNCVPIMRVGQGGRIVLIGSINGSRGKFGQTAYAASKAGLIGLARSAARETGRFGINVNVVEPGMVDTPMSSALPEDVKQAAREESLLGRLAEVSDVAAAVLYLCGPGGRHVTGQVLRVDGGQYL